MPSDDGDHIDEIPHSQWSRERPELDTYALGLVGRLFRTVELAETVLGRGLRGHGLQAGWFDLLAALRRAGAPLRAQSDAAHARDDALLHSGMTKPARTASSRRGSIVERRPDPGDRRGTLVEAHAPRHGNGRQGPRDPPRTRREPPARAQPEGAEEPRPAAPDAPLAPASTSRTPDMPGRPAPAEGEGEARSLRLGAGRCRLEPPRSPPGRRERVLEGRQPLTPQALVVAERGHHPHPLLGAQRAPPLVDPVLDRGERLSQCRRVLPVGGR